MFKFVSNYRYTMPMFTIEQINAVHEKFGNMIGFSSYVTALKLLGVEKYGSYLTDGHSQYFGAGGHHVESAANATTISYYDKKGNPLLIEPIV